MIGKFQIFVSWEIGGNFQGFFHPAYVLNGRSLKESMILLKTFFANISTITVKIKKKNFKPGLLQTSKTESFTITVNGFVSKLFILDV